MGINLTAASIDGDNTCESLGKKRDLLYYCIPPPPTTNRFSSRHIFDARVIAAFTGLLLSSFAALALWMPYELALLPPSGVKMGLEW